MTKKDNNRRLNRALVLFAAGFIAEFYFLIINSCLTKGTVRQVATLAYYLDYTVWIGLALFVLGAVLWFAHKRTLKKGDGWFLWGGLFLGVSSYVMHFNLGSVLFCALVPVVMLLGVAYLLYQREFFVQLLGLTVSVFALVLFSRGGTSPRWGTPVRFALAAAPVAVLALLVGVFLVRGKDGMLGKKQFFTRRTNYALTAAVLALCIVCPVLALVFSGVAYYALWALGVLTFLLAVYYTVKLM